MHPIFHFLLFQNVATENSTVEPKSQRKKRKKKNKRLKKFDAEIDTEGGLKYPPFQRGYVYPPKKYINQNPSDPKTNTDPSYRLKLDCIFGSSSKGVNGRFLHLNKHKKIVYPSAACGVVVDPEKKKKKQKIFRMHEDDLVCIAMHPDGETMATGECGLDDLVHIWNSDTMETIQSLETYEHFEGGGVLALAFSSCGQFLSVVGGSEFDSIILLYKKNGPKFKLIHKQNLSKKKTYSIGWHPSKDEFVWCGKNEIKIFNVVQKGKALNGKRAKVSVKGKVQAFYCHHYDKNGILYVGCHDGSIYIIDEYELKSIVKASKKPLMCFCKRNKDEEDGFWSAGKDGIINLWTVTKKGKIKKSRCIKYGGSIQQILDTSEEKDTMYIWGAVNGKIEKVIIKGEEISSKELFMFSHHGKSLKQELWGLAEVKGEKIFFSAADDGKLICWDRKKKCVKSWIREIKHNWRGCAVSFNGDHVAVSSKRGSCFIYPVSSFMENDGLIKLDPIKNIKCGAEEIACLKYSPNDKYLAIGSHNNRIYIYKKNGDNYTKAGNLDGHTSFITSLDFSKDSKYMQSTSGDYELLMWNVDEMNRESRTSNLRDVEWEDRSALLGWSVRGIWDLSEKQDDGTDVNGCCAKKDLLVSVDDFGGVNVLKFPTLLNICKKDKYIGHCSHVTKCVICDDFKHVLTAGGGDLTIFCWKIKKKKLL